MVRWRVLEADGEAVRSLAGELGMSALAARLLVNRGIETPEDAEGFLNPDLANLHDPLLLPDCDKAVKELAGAMERKETIFIHGDYDVDGVTSATLWTRCLRRLGATVEVHVPHRQKDGYGFHESAVEKAKEVGASLVLTCDCGINANVVVDSAREQGLRVIVTDHHEPGAELPNAEAVVNPMRRDSRYPFPFLAGVGVSFKVASALVTELGHDVNAFYRAFLDLAALGTVCDIVPLLGENRILVRHGLPKIVESRKVGIQALLRVANTNKSAAEYTARDAGFGIGPRINAAGRMDDAHDALTLLLTEDKREAFQLAGKLDRQNYDRQREQNRIFEEAQALVLADGSLDGKLLLVAGEGWNAGVVGIVASKLVDRFWRPALVGNRENELIRGSARSTDAFNMFEALDSHRDLFLSCGGHSHAAGFSFEADRLDEVRAALCAYADERLTDDDLIPESVADAEVYPHEITAKFVDELERFAPFGTANPEPLLLGRRVTILSVEPTRNPAHPRVTLRGDATDPITGMAFGLGELMAEFPNGSEVDMLFQPTYDTWKGQRNLRWFVRDVRAMADASPIEEEYATSDG